MSAAVNQPEMPPRHHATAKAWEWLEQGEGRGRLEEDRFRLAEILCDLDVELHKLDGATGREKELRPYVQHKATCILNVSRSPLRESSWCDCGLTERIDRVRGMA